jgi:hypothetical protein
MNCMQSLKSQLAGETRARQAAEQRERAAVVRAERAEQSERNLTRALDRAHREFDRLRAQVASSGECVA